MRLQNKTCIVTGAGAGIGFATAGAFASEGAKVIALDRDQAGLVALNGEYQEIETHVLDVTETDAVTDFFAALGKVDVLFNCAGMVAAGNLLNCTTSDWARTMELNVTSIYTMCRAAVPLMQSGNRGSIINMGSVISSIGASADRFAYGASKAAVIGMTKSIALDYDAQNIR